MKLRNLLLVVLLAYSVATCAKSRTDLALSLSNSAQPNITYAGWTSNMAYYVITNGGKEDVELTALHIPLYWTWNAHPADLKNCRLVIGPGPIWRQITTGASLFTPNEASQNGELQHFYVNEPVSIPAHQSLVVAVQADLSPIARGTYTWSITQATVVEGISVKRMVFCRGGHPPTSEPLGTAVTVYALPNLNVSLSEYDKPFVMNVAAGSSFGGYIFKTAASESVTLYGFTVNFEQGSKDMLDKLELRSIKGGTIGEFDLNMGKGDDGKWAYLSSSLELLEGQEESYYLVGYLKKEAPIGQALHLSVSTFGNVKSSGISVGSRSADTLITYEITP